MQLTKDGTLPMIPVRAIEENLNFPKPKMLGCRR